MKPAFKLLRNIALVGGAVLALVFGAFAGIPDGSDYALVLNDKHQRLESISSPRLVLVGGSGLAYGFDSATAEKALGLPVANLGLSAWIGLRFVIDDVEGELKAGDTLVFVPEHECFRVHKEFDALYGDALQVLLLVKARPASMASVRPWWQKFVVAAQVPAAAHYKVMRVLDDVSHGLRGKEKNVNPIEHIEQRKSFNAYGDMVGHIGVEWKLPKTPGLDLSGHAQDERFIPALREYQLEFQKRGIAFYVLPPPTPIDLYAKHKKAIDETYDDLSAAAPGLVLARPDRYQFPTDCFFDDVHHLNGNCRLDRTRLVIEDLTDAAGKARRASR